MAVLKLIPRRLTLESTAKYFSMDAGKSTGSTLGMEFEVPDELTGTDLWEQTWREKKKLDLAVVTMEFARGALSTEDYKDERARLQHYYDQLIARKPKDDSTDRGPEQQSFSAGSGDRGTAGTGPVDEAGPE